MLKRHWGMLATAAIFAAGSASAQQPSEMDKVDQMQRQMEQLQEQMKQVKSELNDAKKKATEAKAAASAFDGAYAADIPHGAAKAPVAPPSAIVLMSPTNAPSICTPDQLNCISLTSRLHLDVGGYNYRPATGRGLGPTTGATPGVPIQPATTPQSLDDGYNVRRARIGVLGKFMGDWNYALIYDFGGSADGFGGLAPGSLPGGGTSGVQNAWLSYSGLSKWTGLKGFLVEGGVTDVMYTLDEATSSNDIMFMERASSQVIAANIAAGDFRSFGGLRGYNDWFWAGGFATGPTTGTTHSDTTSVTALVPTVPAGCTHPVAPTTCSAATTVNVTTAGASEQYGSTARLTFQPLTGQNYSVHIGGDVEVLFDPPVGPAGTNLAGKRTLTLSDRPELRIDPTVLLNTGAIAGVSRAEVYSVEAAAAWGPLFFQGEYFWYQINRENASTPNSSSAPNIPGGLSTLSFNGGYVEASWTITGESRPYIPATGAYGRITPQNPVNPGGTGWGAWEIAARYSVMNLNDNFGAITGIEGGQQQIFTAGLNWYVNTNIMFKLNYLHGSFDKQATTTAVVPGMTTFVNVGANFDAVAGRMQIAF
jgi:phosphate-selective porin OprO and OprP